ncbi:hypothetical protein ACWPOB_05170 [Rhodococcus sp. 2H158]
MPDEESAGCSEDAALEALHIVRARPKPVTVTYLARRLGITPEDALERLAMLIVMGRVEQLSDGIYRPIDNVNDVDEGGPQDTAAMNAGTQAEESETVPSAEPDPFDAIMTFRREVQALLPTRRDRETYDLFVSRRKRLSSARAAALFELSPAATGVRLRRLLTLGVIERAGRGSYRAVIPETRDAEAFLHSALPPEAEAEAEEPEESQPAEAPHRLSVDHRRAIQARLDDDCDRQTFELFVENDAFQSEGTVAGSLFITRREAEDRLRRLVERGVIGRKPTGYGTYNRYYAVD